uniref:Exportin-T n=1 Tax=Setaria digitata TaxID=48799 RepID=A0A915PVS0_9BILA
MLRSDSELVGAMFSSTPEAFWPTISDSTFYRSICLRVLILFCDVLGVLFSSATPWALQQLFIMVSVASLANAAQHHLISEYIEKLKNDCDGWKNCIKRIISGCDPEEHFMLLQVIETYLTTRYVDSDQDQDMIRRWMWDWLHHLSSPKNPPSYLVNKMAQLFALVFAADFPKRWPNFMEEVFFQQMASSPEITVFFLRTLIAIDCEVVDREIRRTKQVMERNMRIKDAMRDNCNCNLALIWTQILAESNDLRTRELCLDVIACYIDWIDLELVVNNTTTPFIINCLENEHTCESAVSAINAIVTKGMDAEKKLLLISSLCTVLHENGSFSLKVVVSNFTKVADIEKCIRCEILLQGQADIALLCLSNEDVDASETVIDFLRRYVCILKNQEREKRHDFTSRMICIAMDRYKAADNVDLSNTDGEVMVEFTTYRKQLRNILSAVGNFEPEAILMKLEPSVRNICENWKECDANVIEATLALVYDLADFIHILQSTVTHYGSPYINTLFFEIACHYERVLQSCVIPLPVILVGISNLDVEHEAFLDTRGIRQTSLQPRSRVIYLFCRFVKAHKVSLSSQTENILTQLESFFTETSEEDYKLSKEDQMYLYESASVLIIHSNLPVERKQECMKVLGLSLVQKFTGITNRLLRTEDMEEVQQLHQRYADVIGYSARTTKAFTNNYTMQCCQCTTIFTELLEVFLDKVTPNNMEGLDALRQYLHRMVTCLDGEILVMLPTICDKYLDVGLDLKVMHDFLILLQQIFGKFKKRVLDTGLNISALFDILWAAQRAPVDLSNESRIRDMIYYNRAFLQTILNILTHDLIVMLTECGSEFIHKIADSLVSFMSSNDVPTQRITFQIINKLFQKFSDDGSTIFIEFMWEKAVYGALQIPLNVYHDLTDAQCVLLQHEIYVCLQTLRSCSLERFDQCLQLFLPADVAQNFSECISSFKGKQLERALDAQYAELRLMKVGVV